MSVAGLLLGGSGFVPNPGQDAETGLQVVGRSRRQYFVPQLARRRFYLL